MIPAARNLVSEDEYIERERRAETKSELINGEIIAMAGGSPKHSAIAVNLTRALSTRLDDKPCIVFNSDLRVHVEATGLYAYPDVTVACDGPRFHPRFRDTLVNPRLIIEVLSDSTEVYDRGAKFAHYRRIPSLREVVLVSQHERRVEHYRRLDTGQWILTEYEGDARVVLPSIEVEIPLAEIYAKTELFDAPPS